MVTLQQAELLADAHNNIVETLQQHQIIKYAVGTGRTKYKCLHIGCGWGYLTATGKKSLSSSVKLGYCQHLSVRILDHLTELHTPRTTVSRPDHPTSTYKTHHDRIGYLLYNHWTYCTKPACEDGWEQEQWREHITPYILKELARD